MLTERSRVSLYERTTNKEVSFMARQNPLELLSSGKALWNTWRRDHPDVQAVEPDLHGADLHGADLDGAILGKTIVDVAHVSKADLSGGDHDTDLKAKERRPGSTIIEDGHAA